MAAQGEMVLPGVGPVNPQELKLRFDGWVQSQHPAVDVLLTALASSTQGAFLGFLIGQFSNLDPGAMNKANAGAAQMNESFKALSGGPWVQARNLGVMTGVNAGLSSAIKKSRHGKEDVYGAMAAAFGAGAAFSLVTGAPNPVQGAVTTGCAFAAFNGLFYQLGKAFTPAHDDTEYEKGKYLLKVMGLKKYEKNLKKGQLTDSTIMLWNDKALQEVKIPPGPRLLILHHVDQYRNPSRVLKPALPLPSDPGIEESARAAK